MSVVLENNQNICSYVISDFGNSDNLLLHHSNSAVYVHFEMVALWAK